MTTKKGLFPNLSEEKARIIVELIVGFVGLLFLYSIGALWSWFFLREGTSLVGWIIYFVGGLYLLYKFIDKTFKWFKKVFLLFKKKPQPISFELFWALQKPSISLEDALNEYINRYNLAIPRTLEEPKIITVAKTKLQILEESIFADPKNCKDENFQNYLSSLRLIVATFDKLSPEALKIMEKKESDA